MKKNQTLPKGSRCIVNPKLANEYSGCFGIVLFSQIQADEPNAIGYHDIRLDNGVELLNLYGDEIEAAQPALALDAPLVAIESDNSGAAHQ